MLVSVLALVSCHGGGGVKQQDIGTMKFAEGQVQHAVIAADIDWKPCPPGLPPGCELKVLEGNPKQADLFTVRFRLDEQFYMRPHTHPKDERVTLLKGKVRVAFGENATRNDGIVFQQGDYYVNSRDEIHWVWVEQNAIVQVTGIGPWEVHFVDE